MLSLVQQEDKFKSLQSQISLISSGSFRSGEEPNYDAVDIKYPLFGVRYISSNPDDKIVSDVFNFYFADLVHKDKGNETEVISNMKRAALRMFSILRFDLEQNYNATVNVSASITPFIERWGDEVSGVEMNITIDQFFDDSTCDSDTTGMGFVTIKDQDGNVITTLNPGSEYYVTIMSALKDTIDANQFTIIQNIT